MKMAGDSNKKCESAPLTLLSSQSLQNVPMKWYYFVLLNFTFTFSACCKMWLQS